LHRRAEINQSLLHSQLTRRMRHLRSLPNTILPKSPGERSVRR
jgi:hypothetical protein